MKTVSIDVPEGVVEAIRLPEAESNRLGYGLS